MSQSWGGEGVKLPYVLNVLYVVVVVAGIPLYVSPSNEPAWGSVVRDETYPRCS